MFLKLLMSPKVVAYIVTLMLGRPDLTDDLIAICHRESRCTLVETHKIDEHISNREWYGQVKLGHLDPGCQSRTEEGGWATHGPWGLSAGAHWRWVPPCYQPNSFNNPYVSGLIATRKYIRICWMKNKKKGWCKVPAKVRRNNRKRPIVRGKVQKFPKMERPNNWWEFYTKIPW